MSLKKQSYFGQIDDGVGDESPMDVLFQPNLILVMLLKVIMRLPNLEGCQSEAMKSLLQALIEISDCGKGDCEQEGQP